MVFDPPEHNSIEYLKKKMFKSFALTSLIGALVIFTSFGLYTVFEEDEQLSHYAKALGPLAERLYEYSNNNQMDINPFVIAYYGKSVLPERYKVIPAFKLNEVYSHRFYAEDGFFLYHGEFTNKVGDVIQYYIPVGTRDVEFGDNNWQLIVLAALLFTTLLCYLFWISIQKVLHPILAPVQQLGLQLQLEKETTFFVAKDASSELQHFAQRLNEYRLMKEALVKKEMMFAKYTSHELRTPVAVILGAVRLQAMSDDPAFQIKQRERVLLAAENMQETVEVMLNLVKKEHDVDDAELERQTTSDEFHRIADFFAQKLEKKGIEMTVELDKCNLPVVYCPPVVLSMLLKNLISNAIRSTVTGTIKIEVDQHSVSVIDSGQGLSLDNTGKPTEHGLGLLIVEHLCKRYGWQFSLKNNDIHGCTARLEFTQKS